MNIEEIISTIIIGEGLIVILIFMFKFLFSATIKEERERNENQKKQIEELRTLNKYIQDENNYLSSTIEVLKNEDKKDT